MKYIPIQGTWEAKKEERWLDSDSPFSEYMESAGWTRHADKLRFWSSVLSGTKFCGGSHLAWEMGGHRVADFIDENLAGQTFAVIAHSHGGQVACYAATYTRIPALITVDAPPRSDMDRFWIEARPNIGLHVHLYGTGFGSALRVMGQGLRGWFRLKSFRRQIETADHNVKVPGGHSGVLRDAELFEQVWPKVIQLAELHGGPHAETRDIVRRSS